MIPVLAIIAGVLLGAVFVHFGSTAIVSRWRHCATCGLEYATRRALTRHARKAHKLQGRVVSHLCPVCGSRYGTNLAVARHVKRRHLS